MAPHDLSDPRRKYIEDFLLRKIPKGGSVAVLCPKQLLRSVLPVLSKKAQVFVVGAVVPGFETALHAEADCIIGEPVLFSEEGFSVPAAESAWWSERVVGVAYAEQYSRERPSECDLVPGRAVVCDKGVFDLAHVPFIVSNP